LIKLKKKKNKKASGKGTQASKICRDFGCVSISTGQLLRDEVHKKTDLGVKIEDDLAKGGAY